MRASASHSSNCRLYGSCRHAPWYFDWPAVLMPHTSSPCRWHTQDPPLPSCNFPLSDELSHNCLVAASLWRGGLLSSGCPGYGWKWGRLSSTPSCCNGGKLDTKMMSKVIVTLPSTIGQKWKCLWHLQSTSNWCQLLVSNWYRTLTSIWPSSLKLILCCQTWCM